MPRIEHNTESGPIFYTDPDYRNSTYRPPHLADTTLNVNKGTISFSDFEVPEFSSQGEVMKTFHHDWYYRIHLVPSELNLGNVIADQQRQVLLWNAYFVDKNLLSVDFPNQVGTSITDPIGAPYTLKPLEAAYYIISVSANGPPTIDTRLTWNIPGEELSLPVIGRRINLWPFEPDWASPINEFLEWKTNILKSFNGSEQRLSIRESPRRGFEYQVLNLKANNSSMVSALLWGWQNRNYALPLWMDMTRLTLPATQGTDLIACQTSNRGFFINGLVLLYASPTDYEVIEIESFNSGAIQLKKNLEKTWAIGTKVYPINIARIPDSVSTQHLTDSVARTQVRFLCDPLVNDPYVPNTVATKLFNGKELFDLSPNWESSVSKENEYPYEVYDSQTSGVYVSQTTRNPVVNIKRQWIFKGKDEILKFREFLGRRKGRAISFYCPSWFTDFELYGFENSSAVAIRVKNNEFFRMVGVDTALAGLMIKVPGQQPVFRRILEVSFDLQGFSVLGLDGPVNHNLDPKAKPLLSLIHLCRISSDGVNLNWLSDSKVVFDQTFTSVKQ